ncbi:MAG: hypothetical protein LC122_11780 [Chitinophagales bacterium]|nr:hypothetical protein [Chitinophagales bacterium]
MKDILGTLKNDSKEAGYQVAADQSATIIQKALVNVIEKKVDSDTAKSFAIMLDTEVGLACVKLLAGLALTYAPGVGQDPRAQKVADKLRQGAMSDGMNLVADELVGNLLPALNGIVEALPEQPAVAQLVEKTGMNVADLDEHRESRTTKVGS